MLKILALRALIFATPFVVWFVWREAARRNGRAMGSTPWAWLVAAGTILAGLSLIGGVVAPGNRGRGDYVPAEVRADGSVAPGRFVSRRTPGS